MRHLQFGLGIRVWDGGVKKQGLGLGFSSWYVRFGLVTLLGMTMMVLV